MRRYGGLPPASRALLLLLLALPLAAAERRAPPLSGPAALPAALPASAAVPTLSGLLEAGVARGQLPPELARDLRAAAYVDQLTGLPNKVYVQENLGTLLAGRRSLVTYKLDWLKEINDGQGHEAGNKALAAVSGLARAVVGPDGVLVRRSPTGFAVFTDLDSVQARQLALALRAALEARLGDPRVLFDGGAAPYGGTINLGLSPLGAEASGPARYRRALAAAEAARLVAKERGGNLAAAPSSAGPKALPRRRALELAASVEPGLAARLMAALEEPLEGFVEPVRPVEGIGNLIARISAAPLREAVNAAVFRDPLSGLRNRRWMFEHLPRLFGPAGYAYYLALDIDRYGKLNELLGEEKSDLFIRELGGMLAERTRKRAALPLHLSGEEFVVLLDRGRRDPRPFAENLRREVFAELGARVLVRHGVGDPDTGAPLPVSVSIGVAPIAHDPAGPGPVQSLTMAMAEAMLQRAKENGRNRVEGGGRETDPDAVIAEIARFLRVDDGVRAMVRRLAGRRAPRRP